MFLVLVRRSRRLKSSNISYKFEEFDDLINSAIADEQVPMTEEELAAERAAEEERQRREALGLPPLSKYPGAASPQQVLSPLSKYCLPSVSTQGLPPLSKCCLPSVPRGCLPSVSTASPQ